MTRNILVPIDGSETARKALEYAVDLTKQTGSQIISSGRSGAGGNDAHSFFTARSIKFSSMAIFHMTRINKSIKEAVIKNGCWGKLIMTKVKIRSAIIGIKEISADRGLHLLTHS